MRAVAVPSCWAITVCGSQQVKICSLILFQHALTLHLQGWRGLHTDSHTAVQPWVHHTTHSLFICRWKGSLGSRQSVITTLISGRKKKRRWDLISQPDGWREESCGRLSEPDGFKLISSFLPQTQAKNALLHNRLKEIFGVFQEY